MKRKINLILLLSFLCGSIITIFFLFGLFESYELRTLDYRFRESSSKKTANKDIVLVAIDENSLSEFKAQGVVWEWPRDFFAAIVRYLHRGGVKIIVFDILFTEPDINRIATSSDETDGAFAKAIATAGNVILAAHLRNDENILSIENPLIKQKKYYILPEEAEYNLKRFNNALLPIPLFQKSAYCLGSVNYQEDPQDGVCRRSPLFYKYGDAIFPQIGMAAYLALTGTDSIYVRSKDSIRISNSLIPLDQNDNYLINWYGLSGPDNTFKYYSFGALITSARQEELGEKPYIPSINFKDKIIIIGSNAAGLYELKNTPLSIAGPYPGMEIHATVLSNLIQKDFIHPVRPYVTIIVILGFTILISLTVISIPRFWISILATCVCGIGWWLIALKLFEINCLLVNVVAPELAIILSFAIASAVSYQIEWKSHRQMREEVRLAAKIQQNLFPKTMPSINGYDFAGKSIPARIVGGDYYDFILINDHQLAVCLGDVSGKGLPASLIMANLQATMRGQLLSDCSPKNCMIHSNTLLYRSTSADKFVTFFYALLDTANHQLIYSNAGHDNPILMTKDGNIEKLATGGIVLGIMDDYAFEEKVIPFQVGDVLTIYSDGIVEAINKKKEMFGEDRLISILMKYHSVKAEQIIEEVFDAVKKYSGSIPQSDDITMIVVKRNV